MPSDIDRWNARFSTDEYIFGTEPNAFLQSQHPRLRPGARALAVADGEGRNGVWLAEQGMRVLSVDGSQVALDKARGLAKSRGVQLNIECADLTSWDYGVARFDIAVAIFIQFAAPPERDAMIAKIKESVVPGGVLMLQGYRPEQLAYGTGGPPHVENMYTEAWMRSTFSDWIILELRSHDSIIAEGKGHHGMSALIECVAQRPAGPVPPSPRISS